MDTDRQKEEKNNIEVDKEPKKKESVLTEFIAFLQSSPLVEVLNNINEVEVLCLLKY